MYWVGLLFVGKGFFRKPEESDRLSPHPIPMIRPARLAEAEALTRVSFDPKRYWGYPKEFFDIWSSELTITSTYIENNEVYVFEKDGVIVGYYSLVELKDDTEISEILIKKGFWLDHMFVLPDKIGERA